MHPERGSVGSESELESASSHVDGDQIISNSQGVQGLLRIKRNSNKLGERQSTPYPFH